MNKPFLILLFSVAVQAADVEQPAIDTKRVDLKAKVVAYFRANASVVCWDRDSAKQVAISATVGKAGMVKLAALQTSECHEYKDVYWEAYQEAHPVASPKEPTKEEQDAMDLKAAQAVEAKNALVKKLVDYFKANPGIICTGRDHAKQIVISAVVGANKIPSLKDVNLSDLHALVDEPYAAYIQSIPVVEVENE